MIRSAIRFALALLLTAIVAEPCAAQSNNAAPVYRQAFELLGNPPFGSRENGLINQEDSAFLQDINPVMSPEQRARAEQILAKAQPALDKLIEASRLRKCDWEADRSKGFDLLLPHLTAMRSAAWLVRAKSYLASNDVDRAAALESVGALGRLGVHAGQDSVLISSLVGSAIGTVTMQAAELAIDSDSITKDNAQELIEQLNAYKNADPYRYADSIRGEYGMLKAQFAAVSDPEQLRSLLREAGASTDDAETLSNPERMNSEMRLAKSFYDRVGAAFENPDTEAAKRELRQVQQLVEAGRAGMLAKLLMPAFSKAYESMLKSRAEMSALLNKLQAIADGKLSHKDQVNAAILLARAAGAASAMSDDTQDLIEMMRVAPEALDAAAGLRAAAVLERARGTIIATLSQAGELSRCDFAVLRLPEPSLNARLLAGVRAAARVALADALQRARSSKDPSASVPSLVAAFRASALLSTDPSLARAQVAQSIWSESADALAGVLATGALTPEARAVLDKALATMAANDPFAWRKAFDKDVKRMVEWNRGWRSAGATPETTEIRTKILKQRGATAALARIALLTALRSDFDHWPDPAAPALVRMNDLWPAAALDTALAELAELKKRAEERAKDEKNSEISPIDEFDVPYDLPADEQKEKFRKLDPARGVVLVDVSALQSQAPVVFVRPFDALGKATSTE